MVIKSPLGLIPLSHLSGEELPAYLRSDRVTDERGRYLSFDELQYRIEKGENVDVTWMLTCLVRNAAIQRVNYYNKAGEQTGFDITPVIAETYGLIDKCVTALVLKDQTERLHGTGAELSQLRLEELITSSQLEGVNTTTLMTGKMLEIRWSPHTEDEHTIAGNIRLMVEIPYLLVEPLTPALTHQLYATGMGGINDAKYRPGEFRETDDVAIADYDGDIVHQPSAAALLPERLEKVCQWPNSHEGYIHSLARARTLYFMLAHEHPLRNGNGCTSRALSYWYMLKPGYDVFKYISISSLLYAAPVEHAVNYQHTESDGMNLTYFLEYRAGVTKRALQSWQQHIDEITQRSAKLDSVLFSSGVPKCLNPRQVTLLNATFVNPGKEYTVAEISVSLSISDNAAQTDLWTIVKEGFA